MRFQHKEWWKPKKILVSYNLRIFGNMQTQKFLLVQESYTFIHLLHVSVIHTNKTMPENLPPHLNPPLNRPQCSQSFQRARMLKAFISWDTITARHLQKTLRTRCKAICKDRCKVCSIVITWKTCLTKWTYPTCSSKYRLHVISLKKRPDVASIHNTVSSTTCKLLPRKWVLRNLSETWLDGEMNQC